MSTKYLGEVFDIHGGGNDLKFPHHENEVAQSVGCCGKSPARYWLHTNMLLLNGRKMSKSEGNTISPEELFSGNSTHISKAYSPMAVRFFFLQAHYRSTLDITDEALMAAEKAYKRFTETIKIVSSQTMGLNTGSGTKDAEINILMAQAELDMNDDFNVPKALGSIFELCTIVNAYKDGHISPDSISEVCWKELSVFMQRYAYDIFGLRDERNDQNQDTVEELMKLIIELRKNARDQKDWSSSDMIRDKMKMLNIQLKDGKDGTEWSYL